MGNFKEDDLVEEVRSPTPMASLSRVPVGQSGNARDLSPSDNDTEDDLEANGEDSDAEGKDKGEEDDEEGEEPWMQQLSESEKKRIHLARAFIYNPEVMVLHRVVDELDDLRVAHTSHYDRKEDLTTVVLDALREQVDLRGIAYED